MLRKTGSILAIRALCLVLGLALLINPGEAAGQRRGGRGGGSRSSPTGPSDNESQQTKEFERAAAIHARPEQITQFQQLTKTEQAARKNTENLLQVAETVERVDLFQHTTAVNNAVDELQSENEQFMLSFSDAQKSGLKDLRKKLGKANSEVAKENKALAHELERTKVRGKQIADVARRLDRALAEFQSSKNAVGTEMGIEGI